MTKDVQQSVREQIRVPSYHQKAIDKISKSLPSVILRLVIKPDLGARWTDLAGLVLWPTNLP